MHSMQRAQVPEDGPDTCGSFRRVTENQHRGADNKDDKAVHGEQVRDTAAGTFELRRGQHLVSDSLHRKRCFLATTQGALGVFLCSFCIFEKVLGTLFMHHVQNGSADHSQDHEDDVALHDGRGNDR